MYQAREHGYHSTALMDIGRVGLPRRLLKQLKASWKCPRGCKHGADAPSCTRWQWTVLHKGDWELAIWNVGTNAANKGPGIVVSLSDCTSSTRLIELARTVDKSIVMACAPEPIGLYNTFGRQGVDTGDQKRKSLGVAARRTLRQGPKGELFDFEIALVDGAEMMAHLQPDKAVTMWTFADAFADEVLNGVSARRRTTAAAEATAVAGATRAQEDAHVPVWFAHECKRRKRASGSESASVAKRGGVCCAAKAGMCDACETVRPSFFCAGCKRERAGCNGWYHWGCYWREHKAVLR